MVNYYVRPPKAATSGIFIVEAFRDEAGELALVRPGTSLSSREEAIRLALGLVWSYAGILVWEIEKATTGAAKRTRIFSHGRVPPEDELSVGGNDRG